MRIALILPGFSEHAEHWAIPVLQHLVRGLARTHDVHIFALRYPHRRDVYTMFDAVVHAYGGADAGGLGRGPLLLRAFAGIIQEDRRQSFDIYHGLWADEPGYLAVMAGRVRKKPAVVSIMGGELVGFPEIGYGGQLSTVGRRLSAWALPRADLATVGSTVLATLAQQLVPSARLRLLPLGIDINFFGPSSDLSSRTLDGAPAILHVASLVPIKGQVALLKAFAQISARMPNARLHIVGDGPLRPDLESLAGQLSINARVIFHGAAAHTSLPDFYRAADLFVLSSRFESQSLVVLEAAACGCLPVGTAVGILPDLLPPDLLAPTGDADALAQVILRALSDPEWSAQFARELQRRVMMEMNISGTVERLLAVYEEVQSPYSDGVGGGDRR